MKKIFSTIILISFLSYSFAQKKNAYIIYNQDGKKVSYKKMIKTINKKSKVLLFGEYHNNPISHWLQLVVTKDLSKTKKLTLGAEMLEADNQVQVNDYLSGKIDYKTLDTTARLWNNFKTDYKPLVDFAKENKFKFIATNVPRRYAKVVFSYGLDSLDRLPNEDKQWIAKLPIKYDPELPGYQAMLEMMGGHGGENLPKAQAIKDATMSYFLLKNMPETLDNHIFIHYNGAYHSDNFEGIYWYLTKNYFTETDTKNIYTISTVSQKNIYKLLDENKGKADFIICVDEDMTSTY